MISFAPTNNNSDISPAMFVSDEFRSIFESVFGLWISWILATFGVVTNVLCLLVFVKDGLKDSATVSLAAIALMDLLKSIFGSLCRLYGILQCLDIFVADFWEDLTYIPNIHLQTVAGSLVNVYTTYVTVERTTCVALPLKVKLIFTLRLTYLTLLTLTVAVLVTYFHVLITFEVYLTFDLTLNRTVAGYGTTALFNKTPSLLSYINTISIFWPVLTFSVIMCGTVLIAVRMRHIGKFRSSIGLAGDAPNSRIPAEREPKYGEFRFKSAIRDDLDKKVSFEKSKHRLSRKDVQLVRMLFLIVALYVTNVLPRIVISFARFAEPEFFVGRKYNNVYLVYATMVLTLDFVTSSLNFFIYFAMGSNFRTKCAEIFVGSKQKHRQVLWGPRLKRTAHRDH